MFPNTFWVMQTYIVSYFPKPWNCNDAKLQFNIVSLHFPINSRISMKTWISHYQNRWYCREHGCTYLRGHRSHRGIITETLYKSNKKIGQFVSAIVSKQILGHENIHGFIFSQTLELQRRKTLKIYFQELLRPISGNAQWLERPINEKQ